MASISPNVPNNGPAIIGGMWLMTILPLFFVGLRLFCKSRLGKILGWDEYVLIASWVLLLAYTSCIAGAVTLGLGRHVADMKPQDVAPALRLVYIGEFIAIIACALAKTSFAITLLRTVTQRWQKNVLWYIIVSMNLIMWACAIIYLAQCQPTARLWDFTITERQCWNPKIASNLAIAAGAYSGAMDFTLSAFSFVVIWNLKINKTQKVGVALAMSLGGFAGVVAIIKTSYLTNLTLLQDFTYYCSNVLIWAATETGVTIIAVCIPSFRTLLRSYNRDGSYGLSRPERGYQLNHSGSRVRKNKYCVMGSARNPGISASGNSDKSILEDGHRSLSREASKGAIQVQNEITVEYEDAGPRTGDNSPSTSPTSVAWASKADDIV